MSNNEAVSDALQNVFAETGRFIIIGLTGRTGSGCTTAAGLLTSELPYLPEAGQSHYTGNEARKFKIVRNFINRYWQTPFKSLQIRSVISRYILDLSFPRFVKLVATTIGSDLEAVKSALNHFRDDYKAMHETVRGHQSLTEDSLDKINEKKRKSYYLYIQELPQFSNKLRDALKNISEDAYTRVYQAVGDNIRSSGTADDSSFNPAKIFSLPQAISDIIEAIRYESDRKNEPCYIVIDAIRNPYEAIFLKARYAEFYLVSVNTSNENRLAHLRKSHKFSENQILGLDKKEYPAQLRGYHRYTSQNIQKCIEISDIHINNPRTDEYGVSELRCQLAWYVSLMMHPGLVTPTSVESAMQIAYSVKHNSGCISRQVGAVVTDGSYSVKAVGWNNSPHGQVPCLLRSSEDLLQGVDEPAYSHYERNDDRFRTALKFKFSAACSDERRKGRNLAFCFKDVQNDVEKEKNQVHTRSLHAEENAFLQISKYGGMAVQGGILFTTASPCELCAKKAYQLGINRIVYIDPYPGIATSHVLASGEKVPRLELFRGAVGRAFHKLYQPLMPYKDELDLLLAIPRYTDKKEIELKRLRKENKLLKSKLAEAGRG